MIRLRTRRSPDAEARSRRRFARRQWVRRWLTLRYVLAMVMVTAAVAGGVYVVYFSEALAVEGAEVTGISVLDEDAVLEAAGVPIGGPLATVDLRGVERRVAALAPVARVEVSRKWPHSVLIVITERVPVAVVERAGTFRAVDASGVVFSSYRRAPRDLPRIEADPDAGVEALREGAAVVASLPSDVAAGVDHLEVHSVDEIDLELRDGRLVRWGSAEQSEEKGRVLLALLASEVGDARTFDVSVPAQPTTSG
ncbi:FtsQ-type POTRA domain-containing protein [Nocardioides sp. R-C-SC26]|uniref:cell division protein FtsQ/DivIB n=1 Tax=Nocardioides sp. R-C-SC26 TaxID=2870414 RepID=UPI001E290B3A|nr:FtsQ-type POTRA domain-containing protein [Nocardioides sp. R-C-SC26]